MVESAALLVDEVLPEAPMRQWVLPIGFVDLAGLTFDPRQFGVTVDASEFPYRAKSLIIAKYSGA